METKAGLIRDIDESKADDTLKALARSLVERAYSLGFNEGMRRGSEVLSRTFDMVMRSTNPISTK